MDLEIISREFPEPVGHDLMSSELVSNATFDGTLEVVRSLDVELTYTTRVKADNCNIGGTDGNFIQLFLRTPGQPERPFSSITSSELWQGNCLGDHKFSKTVNPLGAGEGLYALRLQSVALSFDAGMIVFSYYPSIRITADSRVVVDFSYPVPANGRHDINDTWPIHYRP